MRRFRLVLLMDTDPIPEPAESVLNFIQVKISVAPRGRLFVDKVAQRDDRFDESGRCFLAQAYRRLSGMACRPQSWRIIVHRQKTDRHYLPFLVAGGLLLEIQTSTAQNITADKTGDFIQQIRAIQITQLATVVIVPPYWTFRVELNEASIKEVGCTLATRDPLRIAALIEILKRAEVRIAGNSDKPWGPREGIFMTLPDDRDIIFLFGKNLLGQNEVPGMFTHLPLFKSLNITGRQSLPRDLVLWAADTGPPATKYLYNKAPCEEFMKGVPR
jgi:hypothetical protein